MTKSELRALKRIRYLAEENSCGCADGRKGKGYNNHDYSCSVHLNRLEFRKVDALIEKFNVKSQSG